MIGHRGTVKKVEGPTEKDMVRVRKPQEKEKKDKRYEYHLNDTSQFLATGVPCFTESGTVRGWRGKCPRVQRSKPSATSSTFRLAVDGACTAFRLAADGMCTAFRLAADGVCTAFRLAAVLT